MQDIFTNTEKSFGPSPRRRHRKLGIGALCVGLILTTLGLFLAWPAFTEAKNNVKNAWSPSPSEEDAKTTQAFAPAIGPEVSGDMQLSELDASLQDPLDGGAASPCKDGQQMLAFVNAELQRLNLTQVKVSAADKNTGCALATLDATTGSVSISANPTDSLPYADRLDTPMVDGLLTLTTECLTGAGAKDRVQAELAKASSDGTPASVKVLETSVGKCARIDMAGDGSPVATVWLPTGG